jgi:transcriptional regulator with GAF, ATPase, and Fis domain
VLVVRLLHAGHLQTVGSIRRGAIGVSHPSRPRTELSASALARVTAWLEGGESPSERDLLRGIADDEEVWSFAPLVAGSEARGVLALGGAEAIEPRRLAAIGEPIAAVLATERARRELAQAREAAEADKAAALERLAIRDFSPAAIVGADSGLHEVMRQVEQVAPTAAPVLILGETGSGKEVVARAIHERSSKERGPILRVNCGAIPPELVDSELFGHERGSFTGANAQRRGWFERADGGTLFLDEIGELPLAAQVRLLRVLQDGVFERVGGARPLEVDVRIVAATHRDLGAMVRTGQFREDLWYRINVFVIRLPPLRERTGDIAALAEHFAARAAARFGASAPLRITQADVALLEAYDWPGNVRELSAVMERAAILGEGKRLDVARALGVRAEAPIVAAPPADNFPTLDDAIRTHIERALDHCKGRIDGPKGAAKLLAIHPNTLRSRMEKLGMRR